MAGQSSFERRLTLIERGVRELEQTADAGVRATTQQLVQAILDLHATSLERLLEIVLGSTGGGQALIDQLGADPVVGKLLVLHGLHPLTLETRILGALDAVRPLLRSQAAEAVLISLVESHVRVHMSGPGNAASLVERAILDAAPDVAGIQIEGGRESTPTVGPVPHDSLRRAEPAEPRHRPNTAG